MSTFFLEVRTSPARWFAILIAFLTVVAASSIRLAGVWDWSDLTHDLAATLALVVPLSIAAASLEGGLRHEKSQRVRLEQSAGKWRTAMLANYAATVSLLMGGFLAGCVVFGGIAFTQRAYGSPGWAWILASTCSIGAAASIGYVVGQLTGLRWFVPPVLALGSYLLFPPLNQAPLSLLIWPRALYLVTDDSKDLFTGYLNSTLFGQALWYVGVAGFVMCLFVLIATRGRRVAPTCLVLVAVALATSGATLVVPSHGTITTGFVRPTYSCAGEKPKICLAEPFRAGLPTLNARFHRLAANLEGTRWPVQNLQQLDEVDQSHVDPGFQLIYLYSLRPGFAQQLQEAYVSTYVFPTRCTSRPSYNLAIQAPEAWLSGDPNPYTGESKVNTVVRDSDTFWGFSTAQKREWLKSHQDAITDCALKPSDLSHSP